MLKLYLIWQRIGVRDGYRVDFRKSTVNLMVLYIFLTTKVGEHYGDLLSSINPACICYARKHDADRAQTIVRLTPAYRLTQHPFVF